MWSVAAAARRRPTRLPAVEVAQEERALVKALSRYPAGRAGLRRRRAPHRMHAYLSELSAEFHTFYRTCRVIVDDPDVSRFRTALCLATRTTLAGGLGLLGVGAPESM